MRLKICEIRKSKGLTQEELAEKSGVSRGTIIALEADPDKEVMLSTLHQLAKALELPVSDLFFDPGVK